MLNEIMVLFCTKYKFSPPVFWQLSLKEVMALMAPKKASGRFEPKDLASLLRHEMK